MSFIPMGFYKTPGGGGGFDSDYQAVLDYADTQGYTKPSSAQQTIQNQLVLDMKSAGSWSGMEFFYVFANDGSSNFSLINWANPGTYNASVPFGGITWSSNVGWDGDATGVLDTGYNASTQYSGGDDVSMGSWMDLDGQQGAIMGAYVGTRTHLIPSWFAAGGNGFYAISLGSADSPSAGVISQTDGLWVVKNATGNDNVLLVNQTQISSTSISEGTHTFANGTIYLLGRRTSAGRDGMMTSTMKMAFFGDRKSGDDIYTPFNSYLSAI